MRRLLLILLCGALSIPALAAADAPTGELGRVARVPLGAGESAPKAWLDGNRLMVRRERGEWVALAGIPLGAKVGTKLNIEVEQSGRRETRTVAVLDKKYATQHLTVAADQAVLPPEQLARYQQEREHLARVLRTFTENGPDSLEMKAPAEGRRSDTFGFRRIINGMPRSPHGGMDIAAPTGTPVVAPRAGKVIDAGEYVFLGRTLVLDHGQGLLSLYAHLNAFHAKVGDTVEAGATIGEIGTSGRVTGPHLHFSVYLNAVSVDPAIFLDP